MYRIEYSVLCCCLCLNKCLSNLENMERIGILQARNIGMPRDPLAFRNVFGEYICGRFGGKSFRIWVMLE